MKKLTAIFAALCLSAGMACISASALNGDVNRDDDINVTDLTLIAAHVKGIRPLPADPEGSDEDFEGYDAYLMFADSSMNWGNWNGQGYAGSPSFGVDADITGDGVYTVSITEQHDFRSPPA